MRIALFTMLFMGCGSDPEPALYPVRGTIFRGGKPVTGGTVQFLNQSESNVCAVGEIGSDGSFKLSTLRKNIKQNGAMTGAYKAIILFKSSEPLMQPGTVFVVEAKENTFTITLP